MEDNKTPPNDESELSGEPQDSASATAESPSIEAAEIPIEAVDAVSAAETQEAPEADGLLAEADAEADALDDDIEAEAVDSADDEVDGDDEYAADELELGETLAEAEDEIETSPVTAVDWSALSVAGAMEPIADVPDLTASGAEAMEIDIDAALAAVDTLGAVVAAEQERKREEADRREAQRRADEEYRRWAESYIFRRPGMIRVQGGRIVTILPAVALMAVGAVLTLATASGQSMSWQTLTAAASAGLSVSLLSYWLASGRWARGALFAALVVAVAGAWVFAGTLPGVNLSWRVPIIALGAAFALAGLIGRPRAAVWIFSGLGIVIGAAVLPLLSQRVLVSAAPFVLIAAAVLAVLPVLFRTRRG